MNINRAVEHELRGRGTLLPVLEQLGRRTSELRVELVRRGRGRIEQCVSLPLLALFGHLKRVKKWF